MSTVKSIEESTRPNLKLTLAELGIENNQELSIADQTNPNTVTIKVKFENSSIWEDDNKCNNELEQSNSSRTDLGPDWAKNIK